MLVRLIPVDLPHRWMAVMARMSRATAILEV